MDTRPTRPVRFRYGLQKPDDGRVSDRFVRRFERPVGVCSKEVDFRRNSLVKAVTRTWFVAC